MVLKHGRIKVGLNYYRIIRHQLAPHKKMVRILTHTGMVDVTDDHSLLLEMVMKFHRQM